MERESCKEGIFFVAGKNMALNPLGNFDITLCSSVLVMPTSSLHIRRSRNEQK